MRRAPAAALAAAAALTGCGAGGGGDGAASARATLNRYFSALADGRGAAACAQLTQSSRQEIARAARALPGHPGTCAAAMEAVAGSRFGARLAALRHPKVTSLDVRGDRATARVDGVDAPLSLARSGGAWLIEFTPSAGD